MKKLIILIVIMLGAVLVYPQATPTFQVRVANATTTFGISVPIGATVYNYGADKYFVCKAGTASTLTLTTGAANFTQVGGAGLGGTVTDLTAGLGITFGGSDITTTGTVAVDTSSASILSRQRALHEYQLKALASAYIYVGNAAGVGTAVAMSNDATISNTGAVTIANSAVTLAKMANETANTILGNNTASPAAPIALTIAQTRTLLQVNMSEENFESAHDSSTQYIITLANTPQGLSSMRVTLNSLNLVATTQYALIAGTNKVRITLPILMYDKIYIHYPY
jgi:hypothetical protein